MKKWDAMNYQEKIEATKQLNESFAFTLSYIDAETAAHDVADAYVTAKYMFEFEVEDLEKFEKEVVYFIDEYYRCPMEGRNPSPDGLAS
jgi:hypothetical protein